MPRRVNFVLTRKAGRERDQLDTCDLEANKLRLSLALRAVHIKMGSVYIKNSLADDELYLYSICPTTSVGFDTLLSNTHLQFRAIPRSTAPNPLSITITYAMALDYMLSGRNHKLVFPTKKVIIQCSRLKRERHSSLETDGEGRLRGGARIRSCLYSSATKSAVVQERDRKLHNRSREEIEKEIGGMTKWEADQLYYDWSTCCAIWYPSQSINGEVQWNYKTPYGEIEVEEAVPTQDGEEYTNPQSIFTKMKRKHIQQQAQFHTSYPHKRLNDREKHRHDMCFCKNRSSLAMDDENNCTVRLTNISSKTTKHDIFRIINTGPVVCLHYNRSPPRSSGGTCTVVFKRPESAANMISQSMKMGLLLDVNRIKVAYHTIGCPAWEPSSEQSWEGKIETRVLCIKSIAKSVFTLDDWLDFFGQVCSLSLDFTTNSSNSIVFCFSSIEQANTCFKAAEQLRGYSKRFEIFYQEDPCENQGGVRLDCS